MITGTGADIIFKIPVMRQIMAWIGTMPAKRKNITKTFEKGNESNRTGTLSVITIALRLMSLLITMRYCVAFFCRVRDF
jgi:hypothetical protein